MATEHINDTKLILKYDDDNGSYTFSKFMPAASNEKLYDIAQILNGFQADPVHKIIKVTTKVII